MKDGDLLLETQGHLRIVTLNRPPHNFFDNQLIARLGDVFEAADKDPNIRALVLAANGKSFCAGADLATKPETGSVNESGRHLYKEALRIERTRKPFIAAVHGPAIGGGLGLAALADFRVTCSEARFSANFAKLGLHPGFGLTATLPRLVGIQQASILFLTGRRITGEEAKAIGLADILVSQAEVLATAKALAEEISESAPLVVMSVRETLRRGLTEAIETATERELVEQTWQRDTNDFKEGVKATQQRRPPQFTGT